MPLLDLQRRLAEIGRIRIGEKTGPGRGRPTKRDSFRLTSRDRARLEAAQAAHGGEIREWEGQWELDSPATELPVVLMPGQNLSQWWEMWTGGGCARRCDGVTEILSDGPCLCPEHDERRELAADGKACKPTTRLSVLLPDVPGIGCWRLETHGYYAAVELAGAAELLERATSQGVLLPARLRLDQREVKRGGQTRRFAVPTLELDVAPREMLALGGSNAAGGLAALPAAPSIDRDGQRAIFAAARDASVDEDALREILSRVAGVQATADVPLSKLDEVLAAVRGAAR